MALPAWLGDSASVAAGLLGTPVAGAVVDNTLNDGRITKAVGGAAGDAVNAYANIGQNPNTYQPIAVPAPQYGQYAGGAADMSLLGLQGMQGANAAGKGLYNQGMGSLQSASYGASENPLLSSNEAYSRGYDQAGGLQLDREAAMGQAPSQAAYLMQQGLNQGIANQYATMGGARGNAGIALAQGNAGANIANMQNQAYTAAGAQRAAEMAQARAAYDQAAQTMRSQDQNRLNMGNQMAQYNVNNAQQTAQTALQGAQGYGNLASNYYSQAQAPYNSQLNADMGYANNVTNAATGAQGLTAGVQQSNAEAKAGQINNAINAVGGVVMGARPTTGPGIGGSTPGYPKV